MTSERYRWQAAMGALSGGLIAGAMAAGVDTWTADGEAMLDAAEDIVTGRPAPIDLSPEHALGVAVAMSTAGAPLLADPTTVALIDATAVSLATSGRPTISDPLLAKAADIAHAHRFDDAVLAAGGDPRLSVLVGAFVGLDGGLGAIPARLVSTMRSPHGHRGRRYLCGLTNRLLGLDTPNWYDPRRRRGPTEVLPGLWLANLFGISRFTAEHPDGLVVSLCDEEGRLADHPHHLTFHLEDTPRTDANPSLELVVDEVLAVVAAARAAGQPVLVHCRHGASRTGLILRLLLLGELGTTAEDALVEAQCLWPHTSSWNTDWTRLVETRASLGQENGEQH